ncbi:balbiani ring protein 3-like [Eriocheir sinensis]|uniref:balbiani ring protein 3-like n=1 Tax=Eriocheir sinensis TaxID=95602 RepID=UPI0021C5850B|nr:balbiani ring protein 3-like [Eriocheir sinensis]
MKLMKFALVAVAVLALFEGTEQYCSREKRKSCGEPEASIVQLPAPRGYQFVQPRFVELKQCTGLYCDHPAKKCSPKEDHIKKVRFEVNAYNVSQIGTCVLVEVEEHEKCECECAKPDCPQRKKLNSKTCECVCSHSDEKECNHRRAKRIPVMWHPSDCLCVCDIHVECSTGFKMDETTCKCV